LIGGGLLKFFWYELAGAGDGCFIENFSSSLSDLAGGGYSALGFSEEILMNYKIATAALAIIEFSRRGSFL
jgi:hypothetical protein